MPPTNEQIIEQLGRLLDRTAALERAVEAIAVGTNAALETTARRLDNLVEGHSKLITRVALLEQRPSAELDLAIEVEQNKRLEALEANAHPPARDMIAGGEFETAVDGLTTLINDLDTRLRHLDQFCSTLAADVSRVDNKTEPAKGTTAQRLEKIEIQIDRIHGEAKYVYGQSKVHSDRIAAMYDRTRDLICLLESWAPDGDKTSLPYRLRALFNLSPNDAHPQPTLAELEQLSDVDLEADQLRPADDD